MGETDEAQERIRDFKGQIPDQLRARLFGKLNLQLAFDALRIDEDPEACQIFAKRAQAFFIQASLKSYATLAGLLSRGESGFAELMSVSDPRNPEMFSTAVFLLDHLKAPDVDSLQLGMALIAMKLAPAEATYRDQVLRLIERMKDR